MSRMAWGFRFDEECCVMVEGMWNCLVGWLLAD